MLLRTARRAGPPLARRPDLWVTALREGVALAPQRWWTRPPFLPLPDRALLAFRMQTQHGGDGAAGATADDVITWLAWCKRMRALRT